ncbi:MAG: ROK family protein [Chloroflexi bacterium]|nr:ROK family protein [Chloroflexota bacterium]
MAQAVPVVAVDLGGTQIRAGLVEAGQLRHRQAAPTASHRGVAAVLATMVDLVRQVSAAAGRDDLAVGVSSPGPLDPRTGVVLEAPNLSGWVNVPVVDHLQAALGVPVVLGNDANCAALGEHRFGAGQGVRNLCYVTLSTGIGGGVIIDDHLFEGTAGAATEVGHMTLDLAGPVCNCGNIGCWEALASGTAIAAQARAAIAEGRPTRIPALAAAGDGEITAPLVTAAARAGDDLARAILHRAGTVIGFGLVNLAHLFDPDLIILGGGVTLAGDLVLAPARAIFAAHAMPNYRRTCRVVLAALGDDVGLYGAAALAQQRAADPA